MDWEEYRRRTPNKDEREAILHLMIVARSIRPAVEDLQRRLKDYKYLKRDVAMLENKLKAIVEEAFGECPEGTKEALRRQGRDYEMRTVHRAVARDKSTWDVNVSFEDLWHMADVILEERCHTCMMTSAEMRACAIRKTLRNYMDEPEPEFKGGCGYRNTYLNATGQGISEKMEHI